MYIHFSECLWTFSLCVYILLSAQFFRVSICASYFCRVQTFCESAFKMHRSEHPIAVQLPRVSWFSNSISIFLKRSIAFCGSLTASTLHR